MERAWANIKWNRQWCLACNNFVEVVVNVSLPRWYWRHCRWKARHCFCWEAVWLRWSSCRCFGLACTGRCGSDTPGHLLALGWTKQNNIQVKHIFTIYKCGQKNTHNIAEMTISNKILWSRTLGYTQRNLGQTF